MALIALCTFAVGATLAQVKNLVVEISFDSYNSGVYEYQGTYNNKNYWVGPVKVSRKVISWSKTYNRWEWSDWYGDTTNLQFSWGQDFTNSKDDYPLTGWNSLKVSKEAPSLSYSKKEFLEGRENDGKLHDSILISFNKLEGYAFAGNTGSDLIASKAVTVERVPQGMTAQAILKSDSLVAFFLSGNAIDHVVDTNVSIKFEDLAFTNGGKADSFQNTAAVFKIQWINKWVVDPAGSGFTTVKEALDTVESGDVVYIKEGIYTEYDLKPKRLISSLSILGDGPDKTIIQADTIPFVAPGRVFTLSGLTSLYVEGITIQNGNEAKNNGTGGGLSAQSASVEMINCRIINNRAFSLLGGQTVGGGVFCGDLHMKNCEVVGNICDNGNKAGQIYGGGVVSQTFRSKSRIENTTFSKNYARTGGAAYGNFMGNLEVVNCTFIDNTSEENAQFQQYGVGAGIWSQDTVWLYNSICWGNKGTTGKDVYISNAILITSNSIIKDYANWNTDTAINRKGSYNQADPKLDTLAFNCGVSRTFALLEGSPAIDAGDQKYASTSTDQRGFEILEKRDIGAHEANNIVRFEMDALSDTLCLDEETAIVKLTAYPSNGYFEGLGVEGNMFDVSQITEEGWVKITYKFSAPGCENMEVVDSIYAKVCKVNSIKNIELPVRMYPNPVQSELHFDLNSSDLMDIQIMDISGKLVHGVRQASPKTAVNVSELPNGLYFVTVVSGGRTAHLKFVKN